MSFIKFLILFLFIAAISSIPSYAADSSPVAKISLLKNKVQLKSAKQDWHDINIDENLYINDQIRVMRGSFAEITFLNTGSKLRLTEQTQITVENQANDLKLNFGKLFIAVVKGKGGMKIKTPVAVASVMGTVGEINYLPGENKYSVTSIDGTFAVTDSNTANTVDLTTGKTAVLTQTGISISVADTLKIIQSSPDILSPSFIKTGLSPDHIRTNEAGQDVLFLDTANPKEKIEINTQTTDIHLIILDDGALQPSLPVIVPVVSDIGNMISVVGATSIMRSLNAAVPITVL